MEGESRRAGSQQGWPLPKQQMGIWKCSTSTWQLKSISRKYNFFLHWKSPGLHQSTTCTPRSSGKCLCVGHSGLPLPSAGSWLSCHGGERRSPLRPLPPRGLPVKRPLSPRSRGAGMWAGSAAAAPASDRLPLLCLRKIHLAMADLLHTGAGGRGERLGRQGGAPEALLELPSPPTRTPYPAFC